MKKVWKQGLGVSILALMVATPTFAQDASQGSSSPAGQPAAAPKAKVPAKDDSTVVVVTGTLLRGKAPVGTNLIQVGQDKIQASGATTSNELLSTIPQVINYFDTSATATLGVAQQQQVARPNLRNLPGGNSATGSATLLLVDGHRIAGGGVTQQAVDPDLVPVGVLEHLDIVTDGGSATYGADAIGGVMNFITTRKFDGIKFDTHYGAADHYNQSGTDLTMGKTWTGGSAYLSASFGDNSMLLGKYRSYYTRLNYAASPVVPTGTQCDQANVALPGLYLPAYNFTLPGANYAAPGYVKNTTNYCDVDKQSSMLPRVTHGALFAGWSQDLNDKVKIDARAYYSQREIENQMGPLRTTAAVTPSNAYYMTLGGNPYATQQVSLDLAPVLGNSEISKSKIETYGAYATVTADLNDNWELRSLFNYSQSKSTYFNRDVDPNLLAAYGAGSTASTAIDFYNLSATTDKQLIYNLANYAEEGQSTDTLLNQRDIVDGRLFSLPGGDVRLALGVEATAEKFERRFGAGQLGFLDSMSYQSYDRNVGSVFAELNVPIVGDGNEVPGIHSLVLSLSGRYDDYSDFGTTTNPKIGLNYQPVKWITLYGNYGTSFNAPTLVDQLGSSANTLVTVPFVAALKPGDATPPAGSWTVALQGSQSNLKPQTADTWTVGFDVAPPIVPGLHMRASYYAINFKGTLSTPIVYNPVLLFSEYPSFVIVHPTDAQLVAAGAQAAATGGPAEIAPFLNGARNVYELIDDRVTNLGNTKLSGLDFGANYSHPAPFGSVDASISGNYQLTRDTQAVAGAPWTNDLATDVSRLMLSETIGATFGDFRAQLTNNFRAGANNTYTASFPQSKIKDFNVLNAYLRYSFPSDHGYLKNVDLTLNIDNLLDRNPPLYLSSGGDGFTNFTVGRLVEVGLAKKF